MKGKLSCKIRVMIAWRMIGKLCYKSEAVGGLLCDPSFKFLGATAVKQQASALVNVETVLVLSHIEFQQHRACLAHNPRENW